jgi:cell division transport system permease protein
MLNISKTQFTNHLHAAVYSFNSLCRKPIVTLLTTIVIAIAFTLPTLFWIFAENINKLTSEWTRGGAVSLYLTNSYPTTALEQVLAIDGIEKAKLKTPEEGLQELQSQEGMQDIIKYLPENPLPAIIEITPSLKLKSPAAMESLQARLKNLPFVAEAKIDMQWITRLDAVLSFATKIAQALMILLAFSVALIIANTLKLALYSKQEEIKILKLIGATDAYILRPFLYSGIWYGLFGAVLAIVFVHIFMLSIVFAAEELSVIYQVNYPLLGLSITQAYTIVLFSMILGWVGARVSVKF